MQGAEGFREGRCRPLHDIVFRAPSDAPHGAEKRHQPKPRYTEQPLDLLGASKARVEMLLKKGDTDRDRERSAGGDEDQ